jgi:hypothetical protein
MNENPQSLVIKKGSVFFGTFDESKRHQHIVISDKCTSGRFLVVNFTTAITLPPNDNAKCIIHPGECYGVIHQSVVAYDRAQILHEGQLRSACKFGKIEFSSDVPYYILKRIQENAIGNEMIPLCCEEYFKYF